MLKLERELLVVLNPEAKFKVISPHSLCMFISQLLNCLLCFLLYSEPLTVLISSVAFVGVVIVLHIVSKFFH